MIHIDSNIQYNSDGDTYHKAISAVEHLKKVETHFIDMIEELIKYKI